METSNNVQKGWRTLAQKEELILQWQQSGKSRKEFCAENGITYNSLVGWCKQFKDRKISPGFSELKVKHDSGLFAQVTLPSGMRIDFYQSLPADYFASLLK